MNEFVKAALIRMVRTMAQTAIATIGTAMVLTDVNWQMVVSASILSGILSALTSIATGLPEVDLEEVLEDEEFGDEDELVEDPYEGEETEDELEED